MAAEAPDLRVVVARLESQNRWLKLASTLILVLVSNGLLIGQALPKQRVVASEGFVLRDPAGKQRAALKIMSDGTVGLGFVDQAGKLRALFGIVSDGTPHVVLTDQAGNRRVSLSVLANGAVGLNLSDEAGNPRAVLATSVDGLASLVLTDSRSPDIGR